MADIRWRRWELAGLFVTLILGNFLHFVYDWSGGSSIVAAFAAVNESVWEHMKLLAVPWVIWSLVEAVALRSSRRPVLPARTAGLLVSAACLPTVYYTCVGAFGSSSMIMEVALFQAAVLLGAWLSWKIMRSDKHIGFTVTALSLLLLLGLWGLFTWWTYAPPQLPLFTDPLTGQKGIPLPGKI